MMHRMLPLLFAAGGLLVGPPLLAQDAQSRLWDAAIAGDTLAIRQAVADGAKIDSLDTRRNPNGRLALNWAAWHNRVPAIQLLIALGAPLEAENRTASAHSITPLRQGRWKPRARSWPRGPTPATGIAPVSCPSRPRRSGERSVAALLEEAAAAKPDER